MNQYTFIKENVQLSDSDTNSVSCYKMSNEDLQTLFDVATIEEAYSLYEEIGYAMHTHDFYLIIFIEKGRGSHCIDFEEYYIEENTLFFLSPSQFHQAKYTGDVKGYAISFASDFLLSMSDGTQRLIKEKFFTAPLGNTIYHVSENHTKQILHHFQTLYDLYTGKQEYTGFADYMAASLTQLLLEILHCSDADNPDTRKTLCAEHMLYAGYVDFVNRHYKEIHAVKDCAAGMCVALSTLNRNVLKVSGKSASAILNERITLEAKRMLRFRPDMRVKEIGTDLGFEDNSNFVKFFRRMTGMTPIDFREMD